MWIIRRCRSTSTRRIRLRASLAAAIMLVGPCLQRAAARPPLAALPGMPPASASAAATASADSAAAVSSTLSVESCVDAHVRVQLHERRNSYNEALAASRGCADPRCPREIRADCVTWARQLDARMPRVRVAIEANPQQPIALWLDGKPLDSTTYPVTLRVDPGMREIAASQAGQTARVRLTLQPGDERDVTLVLLPTANDDAEEDDLQWWHWSVGGIGSAAVVAFAVLGVQARQAHAQASKTCAPLCTDDTVASIHQRAVGADVALALAAVSGLVLWYSWPKTRERASTVAVAPMAESGAGIRVETTY